MKKNSLFLIFLLFFLLFGCNSSNSPTTNPTNPINQDTPEKKEIKEDFNKGQIDNKLVGKWRSYSDTKNTRTLDLTADGKWQIGGSSGTWRVYSIKESDWQKWGIESYGPTRKIILDGWNKGIADGPIEETESNVDFFWVIYEVTLETYGEPRLAQIKYGHANWE